jgi:hypothetical protein
MLLSCFRSQHPCAGAASTGAGRYAKLRHQASIEEPVVSIARYSKNSPRAIGSMLMKA